MGRGCYSVSLGGACFLLLVFFCHCARFNNFLRRAVTLYYIFMMRFVLYVCFFHGVAVVPRVSGARAPLLCSLSCRGCDARGAAVTLFPQVGHVFCTPIFSPSVISFTDQKQSVQKQSVLSLINIHDLSSLGNGGRVSVRGVFTAHQDVLFSHIYCYVYASFFRSTNT